MFLNFLERAKDSSENLSSLDKQALDAMQHIAKEKISVDDYLKIKKQAINKVTNILQNYESSSKILSFFDNSVEKLVSCLSIMYVNKIFIPAFQGKKLNKYLLTQYFTNYIWKFKLPSLLSVDTYKNKMDFLNAYERFWVKAKQVNFIKQLFGKEKYTWQEAKKLNAILEHFKVADIKISGQLADKQKLTKVQDNPMTFTFRDIKIKSSSLFKKLWLLSWENILDINIMLDVVLFLQGKTDNVRLPNGKNLSNDNKLVLVKEILKWSTDNDSLLESKIEKYQMANDLVLLVRNIGIKNTLNLIMNSPNVGRLEWLLSTLVVTIPSSNLNIIKEILNKLSPNYDVSKLETLKSSKILDFLQTFMKAWVSKAELTKTCNSLLSKLPISPDLKNKLLDFTIDFFMGEKIINMLHLLVKWKIHNPFDYLINQYIFYLWTLDYEVKKSKYRRLIGDFFVKIFKKYSKKAIDRERINVVTSLPLFKKIEDTLESSGLNSYQASLITYYIIDYYRKIKKPITKDVLTSDDFKQYLKQHISSNINNVDKFFANKFWIKLSILDKIITKFFSKPHSKDSVSTSVVDKLSASINKKFPDGLNKNLDNDTKSALDSINQLDKLNELDSLDRVVDKYSKEFDKGYTAYVEKQSAEKKLLHNSDWVIANKLPIDSKNLSDEDFSKFSKTSQADFVLVSSFNNGIHEIKVKLPWEKQILHVESLSKEKANKEIFKEFMISKFWINLSFDNWTADDFAKILDMDITKDSIKEEDFKNLEAFFQTYVMSLIQDGIISKDFLRKYNLSPKDVYSSINRYDFFRCLNQELKSKLKLGGLKSLWDNFYFDLFDPGVKEILSSKYKWKSMKESVLDGNTDTKTIFGSIMSWFKNW